MKRVGVSNFDVALLREAEALCETPVVTNQVRYNLYTREPEENGLLRYCQENNVVLTAYCPLKDGVMQNETVQAVARKHGATAAQVAIRWLTRQPQGGYDSDVDEPRSFAAEHGGVDAGAG